MLKFFILRHPSFKHIENKELAKNDIDVISIYESGISLEEYFKSIVKEAE